MAPSARVIFTVVVSSKNWKMSSEAASGSGSRLQKCGHHITAKWIMYRLLKHSSWRVKLGCGVQILLISAVIPPICIGDGKIELIACDPRH